jgi:hypothetical protein
MRYVLINRRGSLEVRSESEAWGQSNHAPNLASPQLPTLQGPIVFGSLKPCISTEAHSSAICASLNPKIGQSYLQIARF